jgi:hypothetical protein
MRLRRTIPTRAIVSGFAVAVISLTAPIIRASSEFESRLSLEPIKELTTWFPKLVAAFDGFVQLEQKKQFKRRVQTLVRSLQTLEHRKERFQAFLETAPNLPKEEVRTEVSSYSKDLSKWLGETCSAIENLADSLSGSAGEPGRNAADRLNEVYGVRLSQSVAVASELRQETIDIERLRQNNMAGLENLRAARQALGALLNHIDAEKNN